MTGTIALRTALALYPGRYRRDRGEELAVVFADTTAGAGRLAALRELVDLGAYGLRLRTGLTSTSAGGRLAALTAPLAAGAAAGMAVFLQLAASWLRLELPDRAGEVPFFLVIAAMAALPVLGGTAALFGRWAAARLLAGGTALAVLAHLAMLAAVSPSGSRLWVAGYAFQYEGAFLLWSLVLLAAPADALPSPTWRERGLLLVSAVASPVAIYALDAYAPWSTIEPLWRSLMVGVPLLMALTALRGWYVLAVPGLAALPWTFSANLHGLWQQAGGMWRLLPVAALVVTAMVALVVLGRPKGPAGPGGGAGRQTA
ncbi:hypothetical protein ACFVHB_22120 [Kitasatospora sp. NPDC127111]|uniref:hypothetical protein n=1 Tax=Kitasatospora sp. NPDC127111 TaxID=3345363 RepID=UPI003644BAB1